eukprot:2873362-Amphidinium_carterae.1
MVPTTLTSLAPPRARRRVSESLRAFSQELSNLERNREDVAFERDRCPAVPSTSEGGYAPQPHAAEAPVDIPALLALFSPATAGHNPVASKIWASGTIQAMLHDWVTLKGDLRDYDVALSAVILEIQRLREEATQLQSVCQEADDLTRELQSSVQEQNVLRDQNGRIARQNSDLLAILYQALETTGDVERDAVVDRLIVENEMLWKMVQLQQSVSSRSTSLVIPQSATPALRSQRPSRSSRAQSSSSSTPPGSTSSWFSPERRGSGPESHGASVLPGVNWQLGLPFQPDDLSQRDDSQEGG